MQLARRGEKDNPDPCCMSIFPGETSKGDDMKGLVFGQLTVVGIPHIVKGSGTCVECYCSCGNTYVARVTDLTHKRTRSCGCFKKSAPKNQSHGHTKNGKVTSTYKSWAKLKERILNPNEGNYALYGGRGITMDPAWLSFDAFLADMGEKPYGCNSIERLDNNGPYTKENCVWSNPKQQANNRRSNRLVTWQDRTLTLSQWADDRGIDYKALFARLYQYGWELDRAMTQKPRRSRWSDARASISKNS